MPALRYRNVVAAIEWLCAAFGFEKHHVVTDEEGDILYAHLTLGNDMIMVRSVRDSRLDQLMKQPDEIGGAETQSCYFVVDDADVHYHNAKAAGADVVLSISDDGHGGRGYSCRDPEGHIWSFGTYDPWQRNPTARSLRFPSATGDGRKLNRFVILTAILASITAGATAGWMLPRPISNAETRLKHDAIAAHERATLLAAELARERSAKDAAERAVRETREQLTHEQGTKETAENNARLRERQLAVERRAKEVAERAAKDAREQMAIERDAKEAAQRLTSDTMKELTRSRDVKQRAERSAQDALEQLAREKRAKEVAERVARESREQLAAALSEKKGVRPPGGPTKDLNAKKAPSKSLEPTMPSLVP